MKKRLTVLLFSAAAALLLCGCGGMAEKEYVSVSEYVPTAQSGEESSDRISVSSFAQLRQTILDQVSAGATERTILFDPDYEGDISEDLASACWQVRTQDALCAYCVENIAYDVSQIVTYYEARVVVSYTEMAQYQEDIVHLEYSTGIEDIVRDAVAAGSAKLVVLIGRSSYTAESMELLVSNVYRADPGIAPREPGVSVNLFSGTGTQRLYEINLRYGMSEEERIRRMGELEALDPFAGEDTADMSQAEKAMLACEYLVEHCQYTENPQTDSLYSALVQGQAGSEGMALAYVDLCGRLDLDCQIVYGQYNWSDYCWNIIQVDGESYHVDPAACAQNGLERGFLLGDEDMWGSYRWNVASYPACSGSLSYWDLVQAVMSQPLPPETPEVPGQDGEGEETLPPDGGGDEEDEN